MGVTGYVPDPLADEAALSTVSSRVRLVSLPVGSARRPAPPRPKTCKRFRRGWPTCTGSSAGGAGAQANLNVRRALLEAETTRRRSEPGPLQMEVQAIRLGPLALLSMPVEPFAEIGVALKAGSPFAATMVSGYSNGTLGYLPMAEAYPAGRLRIWVTPFAPEAAGMVVEAGRALLAELHAAPAR